MSVGTVFSILPAPHNISASQSDPVALSKEPREVRIEIIPDTASSGVSSFDDVRVQSDLPLAESSESELESELSPVIKVESKKVKPVKEKPVEADDIIKKVTPVETGVFTVPFFSQFTDITPVEWRKVGCGIASVAMLIDFYKPGSASVDELLQDGIAAGAFLSDAGWTHSGLINLSKQFGLVGESHSLSGSSMENAFSTLTSVLKEGPVMASVHYTFDPKNPIPHLVVVNGVRDGKVFYNDPAEKTGGGSVSIAQFQSAWKKRYIEIRPS